MFLLKFYRSLFLVPLIGCVLGACDAGAAPVERDAARADVTRVSRWTTHRAASSCRTRSASKIRPGPETLYVGLLQNEHKPCYRAAGPLLKVLSNLDNALDTRYAAAVALGKIKDEAIARAIRKMASDYPDVSVRKVLLRN